MIESSLYGGQSGLVVIAMSEKFGEILVPKDEEVHEGEGTFPM